MPLGCDIRKGTLTCRTTLIHPNIRHLRVVYLYRCYPQRGVGSKACIVASHRLDDLLGQEAAEHRGHMNEWLHEEVAKDLRVWG